MAQPGGAEVMVAVAALAPTSLTVRRKEVGDALGEPAGNAAPQVGVGGTRTIADAGEGSRMIGDPDDSQVDTAPLDGPEEEGVSSFRPGINARRGRQR